MIRSIVQVSTVLFAISLMLLSQQAQIAILQPPDTDELKSSWASYQAAKDHFEKVSARVKNDYGAQNWGPVQFSADFRAMVLMPTETIHTYPSTGITLTPCGLTYISTFVSPVNSNLTTITTEGLIDVGAEGAQGVRGPIGFTPAPFPPGPSVEDLGARRGTLLGVETDIKITDAPRDAPASGYTGTLLIHPGIAIKSGVIQKTFQ